MSFDKTRCFFYTNQKPVNYINGLYELKAVEKYEARRSENDVFSDADDDSEKTINRRERNIPKR